jgi:hypothetical protein
MPRNTLLRDIKVALMLSMPSMPSNPSDKGDTELGIWRATTLNSAHPYTIDRERWEVHFSNNITLGGRAEELGPFILVVAFDSQMTSSHSIIFHQVQLNLGPLDS